MGSVCKHLTWLDTRSACSLGCYGLAPKDIQDREALILSAATDIVVERNQERTIDECIDGSADMAMPMLFEKRPKRV